MAAALPNGNLVPIKMQINSILWEWPKAVNDLGIVQKAVKLKTR
jgi:hypothetical protein